MLEHLVISPSSGLGNRLRSIASAKRVCEISKARCTVHWTWGDFHRFFRSDSVLDWAPKIPADWAETYCHVKHLLTKQGGNRENRRVWITKHKGIIVHTCQIFNAFEEEGFITSQDLRPWLPLPAEEIASTVRSFASASLRNAVGMHMRRTDNHNAIADTPDELYLKEADRLIQGGYEIFLATDNKDTASMMMARFPGKIITYPKRVDLERRWPRPTFDFQATVDDLVELHLLAACKFVVGSPRSSYAMMAKLYNGSPQCKLMTRDR
jgi:hypothetical protein